ncbi:MAG: homocysteine S-methyltransferase [Akkermansiaceae bacterium]|nr:homocysteine S-methyltransferase [Akkermansiaceae bacterium]
MKPFASRIARAGRLILDGGLASELERAGADLGHFLWSAKLLIENPEAIASVNRAFTLAGADIVTTATYQATFEGLERIGFDHGAAENLLRQAVTLTRRSVVEAMPENPPLVAASIGSYGAFLADGSEYSGQYGLAREKVKNFHRERLACLARTDADLLAFETFPSFEESVVVAELLAEDSCEKEAWFSFTCRGAAEMSDGTPIETVASALADFPMIAAVGVNCVVPEWIPELVARLRDGLQGRAAVIVYPNAGKGWDVGKKTWRGHETPEAFAAAARDWATAGADVIGGCCLTTPDHIRALAAPGVVR